MCREPKLFWFAEGLLTLGALCAILLAIGSNLTGLTSSNPSVPQKTVFSHGGDFAMRLNEVEILKLGVNPYDVWTEKINLPPYVPFTDPYTPNRYERVNAYTPWEYIYVLPLTLLPHGVSWWFYLTLLSACVFGLACFAYCRGISDGDRMGALFVATIPLGILAYPMWENFATGNYDLAIMALLVLMAFCLNRHHDILAGCCWSLAMVKPQIALLFAIPLLWRRKILTCTVATAICLVSAFAASFMCHTPVVDLILQAPAASAHGFYGCGTMPYLFIYLNWIGRDSAILMGCVAGVVVCILQTWMVRKSSDWLLFLVPAFVCSATWTYAGNYTQLMLWPFIFFVALCIVREPYRWSAWIFGICVAVFFSHAYTVVYRYLTNWSTGCLSSLAYNKEIHYVIKSFNQTVVLVLSTIFLGHLSSGRSETTMES